MRGTVIGVNNVNVREANGNVSSTISSLKPRDRVYGDVAGAWPRIYFNKIYRESGSIEILGRLCNAVTRNEANTLQYMSLDNVPEPGTVTPPPVAQSLKVTEILDNVEQSPIYYDLRL